MRPHYKLEAWKNAMNLVDEVGYIAIQQQSIKAG
jgi:hypothetical protein